MTTDNIAVIMNDDSLDDNNEMRSVADHSLTQPMFFSRRFGFFRASAEIVHAMVLGRVSHAQMNQYL